MSYGNQPPGGPGNPPASFPAGASQPPAGQGQQGYPSPPLGSNEMQASGGGFFSALFDFSFTQFVTPKIVKFVYILAMIGLVLGYVIFVSASFAQGGAAQGLVVLIVGAIAVIIYLAFIRMTLEFYYAIVRMSQDINQRLPGA